MGTQSPISKIFNLTGVKKPNKIENEDQAPKNPTNQISESFQISTLRLPVFCRTNKPFMFIKVMNFSEKYRISVNPEFLKNYNLNFKILRDNPLSIFLKNLKPNQKLVLRAPDIITDTIKSENQKDQARIYLKLPDINKYPIQKFTIMLENDFFPGKTIIDKYEFSGSNQKRTTIYMIDRIYNNKINSSIAFISEEFTGNSGFNDFLDYYSNLF